MEINAICIKWGDKYTAVDVNLLYRKLRENTTLGPLFSSLNFYCFTDNGVDLNPDINVFPLPVMNCKPEDVKYAYKKEAGLCDDNLGGLTGKRVFFFDLDVLITDNLDELWLYPKDDEFVIINDWNTKGNHVGQASMYSWQVGTLGYIKSYFEAHPQEVVSKYYTASQEYLSSKVIEKRGALKFFPEEWCSSFKFSCLPPFYLRKFIAPKLPTGTKILAFHGDPKPHNAVIGKWSDKVKFHKRIYKTILPSPWLEKFMK